MALYFRSEDNGMGETWRRPDSSFLWLLNPMKTLRFIIWKNYKWIFLKLLLLAAFVLLVALFLYAMPDATVKKMWGV